MLLKHDLEILIITFNRKKDLIHTLKTVLSSDSPIKDCDIKILDNSSTDGTSKVCNELAQKHQNITHIRHNKNIGLAGNICRAMEIASKKYFWILCDNDELDWKNWPQVQKGLDENYDLVLASTFYIKDKADEALVLAQLTFLPAGIYKTELVTNDIMVYAMADIPTILPHLAIGCSVMNEKKKIFAPPKSVCMIKPNEIKSMDSYTFDRVAKKYKHPRSTPISFYAGIINSLALLKDKKIKERCIEVFTDKKKLNGYGPFLNFNFLILSFFAKKCSFSVITDVYSGLSRSQKILFIRYFTTIPIGMIHYFIKYPKRAAKMYFAPIISFLKNPETTIKYVKE